MRAPADDDASRAATLLADALRTASLPGADDGRFVVVRRLDLGRIPAGAPAATLALHIERLTGEILSRAVVCDERRAGTADVVTFPSRGAAIVALARHHARGAHTGEWFWPMVVSGWRAAGRSQRWLLLLDALHALPEGLLLAATVLEQVMLAGEERELLAAVPPGRGDVWLGPESPGEQIDDPALLTFRGASLALIERGRAAWGSSDDRLVWLATAVAVRECPAMVASRRLRSIVACALRGFAPTRAAQNQTWSDFRRPTGSGHAPQHEAARSPAVHREPDAAPHADGDARVDREDGDRLVAGSQTDYAGLFFALPILGRLGFGEYLSSRPHLLTIAFPTRLLYFIGQRVGLTEEDPMAASLQWTGSETMRAPTFVVSHAPAPLRTVLLSPAPRVTLDSSYVAWLTAVRRWCRREARIGLRTLIRRPGRVVTTRTHTDVRFPMSQVDIRVRRLALDANPGWIPWLGRTISFDYVQADERSH